MNRTLPEIFSDILTYNGSLVEQTDDGALEVIAPQHVSGLLGISEHARLCFSYDAVGGDAIYASYGSDLFKALAGLFEGRGRCSVARFEASPLNIGKLIKTIPGELSFSNAVFRFNRTEVKDVRYLMLYLKYTALSDEKHEGVLPVLINCMTMSIMHLTKNADEITEGLKVINVPYSGAPSGFINEQEGIKLYKSAYSAADQMIRERLKDFIRSLERRLNRDTKRVYEYYETLREEALRAIERKREGSEDGADKRRDKLNVIETERKWKIQDLIAKYALNVHIEPVAAVAIETQAPVFWISIKRRLASREFPVTYNPVVRQFDDLPCESCFYPRGHYYVCDDNLHIVCSSCFSVCSLCGKRYCKACYKDICPKCKK